MKRILSSGSTFGFLFFLILILKSMFFSLPLLVPIFAFCLMPFQPSAEISRCSEISLCPIHQLKCSRICFYDCFATSYMRIRRNMVGTRPDTRHKMRLVCVLFTFENNTGHTDGPTDLRTDLRTYGRTDGRTQPLIEMRRRI